MQGISTGVIFSVSLSGINEELALLFIVFLKMKYEEKRQKLNYCNFLHWGNLNPDRFKCRGLAGAAYFIY